MQNMLQKMTQIIESSRGAMEPLHAMELLSFLGLLAKQDPDGFSAIVNTGSKHQYEAMRELGKKLAKQLHARQNHNDWEGVDASTQELMKRLMESH